jgi:hypothetical protein
MIEVQSQSSNDNAFSRYMRRADAARYIRETYGIPCVATTLAKYACIGGGPIFRKAGKFPIYSRDELDAWANQRSRCDLRASLSTMGRRKSEYDRERESWAKDGYDALERIVKKALKRKSWPPKPCGHAGRVTLSRSSSRCRSCVIHHVIRRDGGRLSWPITILMI